MLEGPFYYRIINKYSSYYGCLFAWREGSLIGANGFVYISDTEMIDVNEVSYRDLELVGNGKQTTDDIESFKIPLRLIPNDDECWVKEEDIKPILCNP